MISARMNAAFAQAERLARHHVKKQGIAGPDKAAWWRLWNEFLEKRGNEWSEIEIACMLAYALAALRYDRKHPNSRGLWARSEFGLAGEATTETAA